MNVDPIPPVIQSARAGSSAAKAATIVVALAVLAMLVALFFFDPARHSLYPQCMLKKVTGLDCPGCGGLRATHQLLHGNVRAAFNLNPLIFVLSPVIAWWLAAEAGRHFGRHWPGPFDRRAGVVAFFLAIALFGVLRNVWRVSP